MPEITQAIAKEAPEGTNPIVDVIIAVAIRGVIYLLYFYLIRQFAAGKSNGNLLIGLLILGVAGKISMFVSESKAVYSVGVEIALLYFIYKAKKQNA